MFNMYVSFFQKRFFEETDIPEVVAFYHPLSWENVQTDIEGSMLNMFGFSDPTGKI